MLKYIEMVKLLLKRGANVRADVGGKDCYDQLHRHGTVLDAAYATKNDDLINLIKSKL